jgi:predicted metal-binding membrane protein
MKWLARGVKGKPAGAPPQRPRTRLDSRAHLDRYFVVVTGTLGIAAASWVVTVWQMRGMGMGAATDLGSLAFFMGVWMPMMAAMMLPGAVPALLRFVRANGRAVVAPLFAGSYLALWTLVGLAVYVAYRPHGSSAAGALTIAAGIYELTPLKRNCRRRCRESVRSGFEYGLYCVGSSAGLMVMLIALGVMSVTLMAVVAAVVLAQKLLPPSASIEVAVALTIVGLGIVIIVAPASVPGFVPTM